MNKRKYLFARLTQWVRINNRITFIQIWKKKSICKEFLRIWKCGVVSFELKNKTHLNIFLLETLQLMMNSTKKHCVNPDHRLEPLGVMYFRSLACWNIYSRVLTSWQMQPGLWLKYCRIKCSINLKTSEDPLNHQQQ